MLMFEHVHKLQDFHIIFAAQGTGLAWLLFDTAFVLFHQQSFALSSSFRCPALCFTAPKMLMTTINDVAAGPFAAALVSISASNQLPILCAESASLAAAVVLHLHASFELPLDLGLDIRRFGMALSAVTRGAASLLASQ